MNGIDSSISFSDFSLLVYGNESDFCVLIFVSATLLNSLISSSNFLILFTVSCHLQTVRAVLLDLDPFISFTSLISIPRTSRTMLNNSGESRHPYTVPDLRGNAFSFSPLRIMFAIGLSYMAFSTLR